MDELLKRTIQQSLTASKAQGLPEAEAKARAKEVAKVYVQRYSGEGEGFLSRMGKAMVQAPQRALQNIYTGTMAVAEPERLAGYLDNPDTQDWLQKTFLKPKSELEAINTARQGETGITPSLFSKEMGKQFYEQGVKPSAGTLAYAVPVGKAGSLLGSAGLGAGAGALSALGATPESATAGETALGVTAGAGFGALTSMAGYGAQRWLEKVKADKALKQATKDYYMQVGDEYQKLPATQKLAVNLDKSQYNVPQHVVTRRIIDEPDITLARLGKYGLHNIDDVERASSVVTGGEGVMAKTTRNIVGNLNDVNTDGITREAQAILNDQANLTPEMRNAIQYKINNSIVNALGKGKGQIAQNANPLDVFSAIQNFEKLGKQYQAKAGGIIPNPVDSDMATAYFQIADALKDRLYQSGLKQGVNLNNLIKPEELNAIRGISPKLAKEFADIVARGDIPALRTLQRPFVNADRMIFFTKATSTSPFYGMLATSTRGRGIGQVLPTQIGRNIGSLPQVNAGVANLLTNLSNIGQSAVPQAIGNVARGAGEFVGNASTAGVNALSRILPQGIGALSAQEAERLNALNRAKVGQLPQPR